MPPSLAPEAPHAEAFPKQNTMAEDPAALKARATQLYQSGDWLGAAEAYETARRAFVSRATDGRSIDPTALAVLHANRAAALLASRNRDAEAAKEGATAVMLDETYGRARSRVGVACVRMGIQNVIDIVHRAYRDLDGLYAFHRDLRRGIEGADGKLLRALRQVDAARMAGNAKFAEGAHAEAALAYTAGLKPDPYNPHGDNRGADGERDTSPIVGGLVLLCNRAAAHAALGRHEDALEDALAALAADDSYVKARGRACEALTENLARLARDKGEADPGVVSMRRRAKELVAAEERAESADLIARAARTELPPEYQAWVAGRKSSGGKKRGKDDSSGSDSSSSSSSSSSSRRKRRRKDKKKKSSKKRSKSGKDGKKKKKR